ncbi:SRPBCC family protein [Winogradskyella sp.]|uniref:SRPBCC family protein n=1 Tax=Winogradskyella sp. TaxID=1883156 RepID=UPI003AB4254E
MIKKIVENIEVRKLTHNHWQTYTDIVINAPVETVWKVLTDWNNISKWSSTLVGINRNIHHKGKVIISYLVDGKTFDTPHVFIYEEMVEFGWSDSMEGSFKGLTDNHRFRVEKISNNQTRFIQSDDFNGLGNKDMSAKKVANLTVKFFPTFNRELKDQVENKKTVTTPYN